MKPFLLFITLAISGLHSLSAQRLLPNQKGIEPYIAFPIRALGNEFSMEDFSAGMALTINAKNGNYKRLALEYTTQHHLYKNLKIPVETYLAEGGYSFFLIGESTRTLAVNLTLNGVLGYQEVNRGKNLLPDGAMLKNQGAMLYGGKVGISVETYLSNRFLFSVQGNLKTLWGSSLQRFRPSVGVGLRYLF